MFRHKYSKKEFSANEFFTVKTCVHFTSSLIFQQAIELLLKIFNILQGY
jgi:hypothetical protein